MSKHWNLFLCLNHFITYTAMTSSGKSALRTGWRYRFILYFRMSGCLNSFGSYLVTYCTGIGLDSCLCTTWRCRYLTFVPCMSKCWNFFLLLNHFITYTTMSSLSKSTLGTGWGYRLIFYFRVTGCLNGFGSCLVTYCTGVDFNSCFYTGRCCCYLTFIPRMSKCRNFFLFLKYFITYTTMTSGSKSALRTGWGYCLILYLCMSGCLNSFGSCIATYCTGIGLASCLCTT